MSPLPAERLTLLSEEEQAAIAMALGANLAAPVR